MNVDGVIVSQVSDSSAAIGDLRKRGIPVVGIDRALETEKVDRVVVDNRGAGLLAARYLRSMGHRDVLCLGGPASIKLSRDRWEGFTTYFAGQDIDVPYVEGKDFGFEAGVRGVQEAFRRGLSFTALWAQSDLIAIGAMKELTRLGTRIPMDVSVLGMDDIRLAEMLTPELSSIRQPLRAMCDQAVDSIVARMDEPEKEAETITLETELIIRSSVVRRT
jgi:DNA-binding LacI/PurR family transcriptional regulator